jgi:hypothetical protein
MLSRVALRISVGVAKLVQSVFDRLCGIKEVSSLAVVPFPTVVAVSTFAPSEGR